MYRTQSIESSATLPPAARTWSTPVPSEDPKDGWEHDPWEVVEPPLGDFMDTEILEKPTWDDVEETLATESRLFAIAAASATTDEQFDQILDALESGDADGLDAALVGIVEEEVDGTPALEFPLEIGVAGVTLALNILGMQTRASCRGHGFGWAPHPVIYFVATDEGIPQIAESVTLARCGFGVDPDRANLVFVEAPDIPAFLHLGQLLAGRHSRAD